MNIEQTISFYLDGTLNSEQEAEFHHLLSVSPEARTLFREHMALQSVARDERMLMAPEAGLRSSLFATLAAEGMDVDAMPVSGTSYGTAMPQTAPVMPTILDEPLYAEEPLRTVAEMRPPVANTKGEEKRRRRLLPFLIPALLLTITASALLLNIGGDDLQRGTPVLAEATPTPTESERSESAAATEAPIELPAPSAAIASTDRDEPVTRSRRSRRSGAAAVAPASAITSITTNDIGTNEEDQLLFAPPSEQEGLAQGLAHSQPPSSNFGGLDNAELINAAEPVAVNQTSTSAADEANLESYRASYEVPDGEESYERIADPEELRLTNAMVGRDPNALEDIIDEKRGFLVSLKDENGNPVTSTLENKDVILSMLRGEGIAINPDGTFTVTSDNEGQQAADAVADADPAIDDLAEVATEELESTHVRIGILEEPYYAVAVEGNLGRTVSESERVFGVYPAAADNRSDLSNEFTIKGGKRTTFNGPLMVLAVLGSAEYGESTFVPDGASLANSLDWSREFWVGVGTRYSEDLGMNISAGAEVVVGVGEKRFHANLSAPILWKFSNAIAIELVPTVGYRNAHAPIRPTTGTQGDELLQGPAHDEEWRVGTGIGFLFFLW